MPRSLKVLKGDAGAGGSTLRALADRLTSYGDWLLVREFTLARGLGGSAEWEGCRTNCPLKSTLLDAAGRLASPKGLADRVGYGCAGLGDGDRIRRGMLVYDCVL